MKKQPNYLSYLLRLWRVNDEAQSGVEGAAWRVSLEDPHTGERKGFADLEALFGFLRTQVGVTLPHDSIRVIKK